VRSHSGRMVGQIGNWPEKEHLGASVRRASGFVQTGLSETGPGRGGSTPADHAMDADAIRNSRWAQALVVRHFCVAARGKTLLQIAVRRRFA
jgi:hypothetical protein